MVAKQKLIKTLLKLDIGCGPNKREGHIGVDSIKFDKVDVVLNVCERFKETELQEAQKLGLHIGDFKPWPWKNESVESIHSSHFVEHLDAQERVHFVNELHRVLIPGGTAQIIVPHWAAGRAYGDPTHKWPPVSEFWFFYLREEWRKANAPHTDIEHNPQGYNCNFEITYGYSLRPDVLSRNQEYQHFAMGNYKEVCQDMIANFKKI